MRSTHLANRDSALSFMVPPQLQRQGDRFSRAVMAQASSAPGPMRAATDL